MIDMVTTFLVAVPQLRHDKGGEIRRGCEIFGWQTFLIHASPAFGLFRWSGQCL